MHKANIFAKSGIARKQPTQRISRIVSTLDWAANGFELPKALLLRAVEKNRIPRRFDILNALFDGFPIELYARVAEFMAKHENR